MMKKEFKPRVLAFLAAIVIALVVNIPMVVAQQSQFIVTKFSGNDNIDGYARGTDTFVITANARIPNEAQISRDQARIFFGTDFVSFFTSCTPQTGSDFWTCTYTNNLQSAAGSQAYTMKLLTDSGSVVDSITKTLVVDSLAPAITNLDFSTNVTRTGDLDITYRAQDSSAPGDSTHCIGLKEIVFKIGAQEIKKETLSQRGQCVKEGTFAVRYVASTAQEDVTVCATATDHFLQAGTPVCKTFRYDAQAPTIQSASVKRRDGSPVVFVRDQQSILVDISVGIAGGDVASARADFSQIVGTGGFTSVPASRITSSGATWDAVPVSRWNDCKFIMTATDGAGNTALQTVSCGVRVDNTGPEILGLRTDRVKNGSFYVGVNTAILADVKEAGVGITNTAMLLNGFNLGLSDRIPADNCTQVTNGTYSCVWTVTPSQNTGSANIVVNSVTSDLLGNQLAQTPTNSLTVTINKIAPAQPRLANRTLFHAAIDYGDSIVRGDTIEWRVESSAFDTAVADLSQFGGPAQALGVCEPESAPSAKRLCFFSTVVSVSGPVSADAVFTFTDTAGNTAVLRDKLFVYGLLNDPSPNFLTSTTTCSPSAIDRSTAALVPVKVYCAINLKSIGTSVTPLAVELGSLSQCTGTTSGFVGDISIVNSKAPVVNGQIKPLYPYLSVTLQPTEFTIQQLDFTCPISVTEKVGNSITANPEVEKVHVQVSLYNMPLGELTKARDDKIKKAVDEAKDYMAWVGTLRKIFEYAEALCKLINILYDLVTTMSYLALLLGQTADAVSVLGPLGAGTNIAATNSCVTAESLRQGVNEQVYGIDPKTGKSEGVMGFLHKFCSFVNCQIGLGEVLGIDGKPTLNPTSGVVEQKTLMSRVYQSMGGSLIPGSGKIGDYGGDPRATINVKESMIWSVVNLCIPGIIYNLDKLRQIQCRYALCLEQEVKAGFPESTCEDLKNYLTCKYWAGEMFRFFPLTSLLDYYSNLVKGAMSDPLQLLGTISGIAMNCRNQCLISPKTGAVSGCLVLQAVSSLGQSIQDIKGIIDNGVFNVGNDWCDQLDKATEEKTPSTEQPTPIPGSATGSQPTTPGVNG